MDDNAQHVKVNRKNTKRIVNKNSSERFKILRANRYNPIIKFISKYVDKNAPLLDIGIREGKFLQVLKEVGFTSIHGIDVYVEGVERANRLGFEAKVADAQDFSFGKKFDTITMSHVLEHCPDIEKTIQNIYMIMLLMTGDFFILKFLHRKKSLSQQYTLIFIVSHQWMSCYRFLMSPNGL